MKGKKARAIRKLLKIDTHAEVEYKKELVKRVMVPNFTEDGKLDALNPYKQTNRFIYTNPNKLRYKDFKKTNCKGGQ